MDRSALFSPTGASDCLHLPLGRSAKRQCRSKRLASLQTRAQMSNKGKKHRAEQLNVLRELGQGSYGQVFEGTLQTSTGKDRVVLKRVKPRVEAAEVMGQMEHLLNVYAAKAAPQAVAHFLGYIEVTPTQATKSLTEGLWLMWRFEGSQTLWSYMRRTSLFRDECLVTLAADLCMPEPLAVATVMRQLCENLSAMHTAGLVHRDVKPANIIFAEQEKRFKLIDLGACADLRAGTNYVPDEGIMDPSYCPPEQYCLPTDSPDLARQFGVVRSAMSPMLWSRYKPDRFDSWSAGMVLLQLAVPKLRQMQSLRDFTKLLKREDCDIYAALKAARLPAKHTALLDADNGVGLDLLAGLLRPRSVEVMDDGGVRFVNHKSKAIRLPVSAALLHPYLQQAVNTSTSASAPSREGGSFSQSIHDMERTLTGTQASASNAGALGNAITFWKKTAGQLLSLEKKLVNQAAAVEFQTTQVTRLRTDVAQGRAKPSELQRSESLLDRMQGRLAGLQKELTTTAASAQSILGGFLGNADSASIPPAASISRQPSARAHGLGRATSPPSVRDDNSANPGGSSRLNTAATSMVMGGLKFTGLALNIATDLARSLSTEAVSAVAKLDAEVTAQRQAQRNTRAFLQLLQSASPAVTSQTSWEEMQSRLATEPIFQAVPAHLRLQIFQSYQAAVRKLEAAQRQQSAAAFQDLLTKSHQHAHTSWVDFQQRHASSPAFQGIADHAVAQRMFQKQTAGLLEAAGKQQAAAQVASAFTNLLSQLQPPLTPSSLWQSVRHQIQGDQRYHAVRESDRQALFMAFIAGLPEDVQAAESVPQEPELTGGDDVAARAQDSLSELQALRAEQARMKAEYDRMETKLKEMEARLQMKEPGPPPSQPRKINSSHLASRQW
ncbi:hypothetical protein WJX74_001413 [Apatococcus lobatus]|uniref:Protein kinase domain-containing protein n=1 Tax=Apatococcus lobatus TaxID=904363 RepID=A0AAW1RZ25_9CHLO